MRDLYLVLDRLMRNKQENMGEKMLDVADI